MILPDVLAEGLAVVFCATDTGDRPEKMEVHYAALGDNFWSVLHRTGLTPRELRPEEHTLVLAHDLGLTDLVRRRVAADAGAADPVYDVKGFRGKIAEHRPGIVAFNGKEAARPVLGRESLEYGRQPKTFEGAVVYVLPSTARKARRDWEESHWKELAREVKRLRRGL
jgi:TDG/mug DNA glycosylase family protein